MDIISSLLDIKQKEKVLRDKLIKLNTKRKKLQLKCNHPQLEVSFHEKATAASMYDGSQDILHAKCNVCGFDTMVDRCNKLFSTYLKHTK